MAEPNIYSLKSPFVILQSSAAQSSLQLLRYYLAANKETSSLFFAFLNPQIASGSNVVVHDLSGNVAGYDDGFVDPRLIISDAIDAETGPLSVFIDSVDCLLADIGSFSDTCKFLNELSAKIKSRGGLSALILHIAGQPRLVSYLTQISFSSPLLHLIAHPTVLLTHLAQEYGTPPPPRTPEPKFWSVFLPFKMRADEAERLVWGPDGEGGIMHDASGELVVECIRRAGGESRKQGVERTLTGWNIARGPVRLDNLEALKGVFTVRNHTEAVADPTSNVSFNLNLTTAQQNSRAQVPLPYAHNNANPSTGAIYYDPDSADDFDEDDPDEDLDI